MAELQLLTQGAEARIFTAKWLGCDVIIKQRFKKKYRHPDLDKNICRERMKAEARALIRCKMAGLKVPTVYDINLNSQEIIIENIRNSLQVRKYIYENVNKADLLTVLAEKIGIVLGKLHKNHIIHGDLTTSNLLVIYPFDSSDIYLLDFGLSFVSELEEDKAVDLYVLERAILSTHPNSDFIVSKLLASYVENGGPNSKGVIKKLDEVRLRGRKKLCFG